MVLKIDNVTVKLQTTTYDVTFIML